MNERQRKYLDLLSQTQSMPPARWQEYQRQLLKPLIRHAVEHVPFYRDRLAPLLRTDGTVDFGRWPEIPVFGRLEAQKAGHDLHAIRTPEINARYVEGQTSGSTGVPFRHRRSNLCDLASNCLTQRDYDWYGVAMDETLADIHDSFAGRADYPEGRVRGTWNLRGAGKFIMLDVRTSVEQQIDWLQRKKPRYYLTYPSLLRAQAEHLLEARQALSFDLLFTTGEALSPEVRQKAQRAFGARIYDRYGATEIGHLATECPTCGQYHVSAEASLVEVLRDDGTTAAPGETGRVVVTSFYNYAMPFIRYAIGDFAEVGVPGACYLTLPSLRRIIGRERNVFTLPDGSRVWPNTLTIDMQAYLGFRQIQVVQITKTDIEVRYVPDDAKREPDDTGLQDYFRSVLHPDLIVRSRAVERIERLPSHKFEDYVSLVQNDGPRR
jgi:phenylacetate-CoA ligase